MATTDTFNYTGSSETWTAPDFAQTITIEVWGPSGGSSNDANDVQGGTGGNGGYIEVEYSVAENETLDIYVGELGGDATNDNAGLGGWGYKNGGDGRDEYSEDETASGGGGGASAVLDGGGNVITSGGAGGGASGATDTIYDAPGGGGGARGGSGGDQYAGDGGGSGAGGNGGSASSGSANDGGHGGTVLSQGTEISSTVGNNTGNGQVSITYITTEPPTIDGSTPSEISIDGDRVQEITIDGNIAYETGPNYYSWSDFTPTPPHSYNISNGYFESSIVSTSYSDNDALYHDQDGSIGSSQDNIWATAFTVDMTIYDTLSLSTKFNEDGSYDYFRIWVGGDLKYNFGENDSHGWTDRTIDVSGYSGDTELKIGHWISGNNYRNLDSYVVDPRLE